MCKKNKDPRVDLDCQFSGEKLSFISDICAVIYDHESKREQSILEQSGKLQVFHGLFAASFFLVFPSADVKLLSCWDKILIQIMAISFLLSLAITFFVQWRYRYSSFPSISEIAEDLKKNPDGKCSEDIKASFNAHYFPEMIASLATRNSTRCTFLIAATFCSFACVLSAMTLFITHMR